MKEPIVSKELAQLLKEKGFDWEVRQAYYKNSKESSSWLEPQNHNKGVLYVSAPTLSHAAMWLRKVHNLHIRTNWVDKWYYVINDMKDAFEEWGSETDYSTHDDCLIAAIEKALKELT